MALGTDSPEGEDTGLRLAWSGRLSLTSRILAVNIFALALLAGSFFYLDSFRARLIDERRAQALGETRLIADVLARADQAARPALSRHLAALTHTELVLSGQNGQPLAQSLAPFRLRDPAKEPWQRKVAATMDRIIDWIVRAEVPPPFLSKADRQAPPIGMTQLSLAPDRTHMISATARVGNDGQTLVSLRNARDIRRIVRAERSRLGTVIAIAILLSIFLSLFLARTIVRPLQRLADAAMQVRLGHAREVTVPRLPNRRDEIGLLARALSDMSHALRQRIDATEAFAADVAHEMKNPLASLASAVQSLQTVKDPALQGQLQAIVQEDVQRLDRLITDISELSRIDAQMARTRFEPVDLGAMIENLVRIREDRGRNGNVRLAYARPARRITTVMGDSGRLARVVENLLDNAVSFSPPGGVVRISATQDRGHVRVRIDDDGPGIPESAREAVFERFHSDRPESEDFGKHSGLGLAIARTIIEAHGGNIVADEQGPASGGARLEFRLPVAEGQ